ncbi:MAG: hypothetical protein ACI7YS_02215 [Flavobacterium sp.]
MKYFLLISSFIFLSCHQKDEKDDYMTDFDNNQFDCLVLNKTEGHYSITSVGTIFKVDGAIITWVSDSKIEKDTIGKGAEIIPAKILDYKSNTKFGIALQKPIYELPQYGNVRPNEFRDVIEKSHKVNYWVIVKRGNIFYGPLNREGYIKKRIELGVPKSLQLDEDY